MLRKLSIYVFCLKIDEILTYKQYCLQKRSNVTFFEKIKPISKEFHCFSIRLFSNNLYLKKNMFHFRCHFGFNSLKIFFKTIILFI